MTEDTGYIHHHCNNLPQTGIEVVYCNFYDIEEEGNQWWLHIYREASEEDVMDGEAEEVDEIIFCSATVIFYCPFCGIELATQ